MIRFPFRKTYAIAALVLMLTMSLSSSSAFVSTVSAVKANRLFDTRDLHGQIRLLSSTLDISRALSVAIGSHEFQVNAQGRALRYESLFNTWSVSSSATGYVPIWEDVNLVFSLTSMDSPRTNIIVSEDPDLKSVIRVTLQTELKSAQGRSSPYPAPSLGGPMPCGVGKLTLAVLPDCSGGGGGGSCATLFNSANWNGYEFSRDCPGFTSLPVYEATSVWTVPAVSVPWRGACDNLHCDISIWTGLEQNLGGANGNTVTGIAQAGTESGVTCNVTFGCSYAYYAWYEFYTGPTGASAVRCGDVSAGDVIKTDVINDAIFGGSAHSWEMYVDDAGPNPNGNPPNRICNVPPTAALSNLNTPYYASFIVERPNFSGVLARLPQFDSVSMDADLNHDSVFTEVYGSTAYTNGWYSYDAMWNAGTRNMYSTGAVSGVNGRFTQYWLSSAGT